jgi:hypothetical protein
VADQGARRTAPGALIISRQAGLDAAMDGD